jgi:hypothetical protein
MISFSIIFLAYFLNNPLKEPFSKIKYPYVLSVKPKLAPQHESVQIYYSSLNKTNPVNNLALVVIDPFGNKSEYPIEVTDKQSFIFPRINTYNHLPIANYSIILESNNQLLNSINFRVVL